MCVRQIEKLKKLPTEKVYINIAAFSFIHKTDFWFVEYYAD